MARITCSSVPTSFDLDEEEDGAALSAPSPHVYSTILCVYALLVSYATSDFTLCPSTNLTSHPIHRTAILIITSLLLFIDASQGTSVDSQGEPARHYIHPRSLSTEIA